VKDAVLGMKSDSELLEQLNKELVLEDLMEQDHGSAAGWGFCICPRHGNKSRGA
jgi:hypothetical protein